MSQKSNKPLDLAISTRDILQISIIPATPSSAASGDNSNMQHSDVITSDDVTNTSDPVGNGLLEDARMTYRHDWSNVVQTMDVSNGIYL